MTGLLIALGVLAALWFLPLGILAVYGDDLSLYLTVSALRVRLYPTGTKKEKKKKPKKKEEQTPKKKSRPSRKTLEEYLRLVLELLGQLRKKLRIRELTLHGVFGGKDKADAALNYGKAWAAIGLVMPLLEACFVIRRRDVQAVYRAEESAVRLSARAEITITRGRILQLAVLALVRFLKIKRAQQQEQFKKAVQVNEQSH